MCNILTVIPNKDYVLKGEDALKQKVIAALILTKTLHTSLT